MRERLGGVTGLAAGVVLAASVVVAPREAIAQAPSTSPPAAETPGAVKGSGLPVPRFVSLKSDRVNVRQGPGTDYPAAWVFRRAGLPVEVIQEFETWRKVRDAEGTTGWVLGALLSGRRTALVLPWEIKPGAPLPQVAIRSGRSGSAGALAMIEAGVIADISSCDGRWCSVTIGSYAGYVEQKSLWGVYENETVR
ncbi:MAG: SH3 domain-containing protein [Pseudomonadota bacterium]